MNKDQELCSVGPDLAQSVCKCYQQTTKVTASKERVNQYVTMFFTVITLKFLSDKQTLVFVRVYSVINM